MVRLLQIIFHARRSGLLRLRKADKPIRLDCIGGACGLCCEVLGAGVAVSDDEAKHLGESSLMRLGNQIVLRSNGYSCALLKDKACTCYDKRPHGCHEYPWYRIEGQLYYDAGCPGMKFDRDERPSVDTITPFERYLPGIPALLQKLIKMLLLTK